MQTMMQTQEEQHPEAQGKTTFRERQDTHRESTSAFFSKLDHYQRLEKVVFSGKTVYPMLMYFITEYSRNRMFVTPNGAACPRAAYTNALRSKQKRFYNFDSRQGKGDLWYNGIVNPVVLANSERGSIALPLPLLVALKWLIQEHFDTVFWEQYTLVRESYTHHAKSRKEKYMATHKNNKRELRQEVESVFIQEKKTRIRALQKKQMEQRDKDGGHRKRRRSHAKSRRDTRLSRPERAEVFRLIQEEKVRRKEESKKTRIAQKKRGACTKKSATCCIYKYTKNGDAVSLPAAKPIILQF
jgi:hypothetical protein